MILKIGRVTLKPVEPYHVGAMNHKAPIVLSFSPGVSPGCANGDHQEPAADGKTTNRQHIAQDKGIRLPGEDQDRLV